MFHSGAFFLERYWRFIFTTLALSPKNELKSIQHNWIFEIHMTLLTSYSSWLPGYGSVDLKEKKKKCRGTVWVSLNRSQASAGMTLKLNRSESVQSIYLIKLHISLEFRKWDLYEKHFWWDRDLSVQCYGWNGCEDMRASNMKTLWYKLMYMRVTVRVRVGRFWWQRRQQANKPANAPLTVQTASHSLERHDHQVRQDTQSKYEQFVRKNWHSIFIKTTEVLSVADMKSALLPACFQQRQAETEPRRSNASS